MTIGEHVEKTILEYALDYAERGWRVFPVHTPMGNGCSCGNQDCSSIGKHPMTRHGVNDAVIDKEQIHIWWEKWPNANIGVATGADSGLVVLDVDAQHDGLATFIELFQENGSMDGTYIALTGNGGLHLFFQYPEVEIRNATGIRQGIDVRGNGGYVVAPPSQHASGQSYEWLIGPGRIWEIDDIQKIVGQDILASPSSIPDWLLEIIRTQRNREPLWYRVGEENLIADGIRNVTFARFAGRLRRLGCGQLEIEAALSVLNQMRCQRPVSETEVRRVAQSISSYRPGPFTMSDIGNGRRFVTQHHDVVRYCVDQSDWMVWTGSRWQKDNGPRVEALAKITAESIREEAVDARDDKHREKIMKFASNSENLNRIRNMISAARSEHEIHISSNDFDTDPWFLNCQNGVIDLRTGELISHDPSYFMTKSLPVGYDTNAGCPRWEQFLHEIMGGDQEMTDYLQRVIGYSLTGNASEECLFILYGTGANGKSKFIGALNDLFGDYGIQADFNTFLRGREDKIRNDVAELAGHRLVAAGETIRGKNLDEGLIKKLTGRDIITSRFLYQENIRYVANFKLFLFVNDKPDIAGLDEGIWRRIHLIPFEIMIPENRREKNLDEQLRNELPGILKWAVQGCLQWQEKGLRPPEKVVAATGQYREEMDILRDFFEERLIISDELRTPDSRLYDEYKRYVLDHQEKILSLKEIRALVKSKGFTSKKTSSPGYSGVYHWFGIGLKDRAFPEAVGDSEVDDLLK